MAGLALCFGFVPMLGAECPSGAEQKQPTMLAADVHKGKGQVLTPECMTGIKPGTWVRVSFAEGGDDPAETVEVTVVTDRTFTATLGYEHKAGDMIEVVPCYPRDATGEPVGPYRSAQGAISVGCPKVWRSERVFTVLDGMLRDVDSITLKALQDLDPNQANLAQIVSVVNDLQVKAQFNQANEINNQFKLQQMKAQRAADLKNFNTAQKTTQDLLQQKDKRLKELEDLQDQAKSLAPSDLQDNITKQNFVKGEINDLNAQIQTQTITDQSLAADQSPSLSPPATGTALATLPDSFSKALQNSLQQPTLPASMQMDNVIELLHQRLAREFTVMYDDLARQSEMYEIYLLQFDIGIVPRHDAKDRDVQVKFRFRDPAVLAYELYPGTSNYNIMRGMDKTNRLGISGAAQTIFGFGLAASFNHERHELRSGLSQSLFVSGFGAGTREFGWLIGPAPYENFVNPGNRIVHALILVPKNRASRTVDLSVSYCWTSREQRYHWPWTGHPENCSDDDDHGDSTRSHATVTRITVNLPEIPQVKVTKVAYVPSEAKELPGAPAAAPAESNYLLLSFKDPIDPNLVITAGSKIINRVRDVRGRAMYGGTQEKLAGNTAEQAAVSASRFGFLEKDSVDPDTWLQTSANSLVMNISRSTAGTDVFPVVTLSDPGGKTGELTRLLVDEPDIRVGEWKFLGGQPPLSAYQPLFTQKYSPGRIKVFVDQTTCVGQSPVPIRLRIVSETFRDGAGKPVWLHGAAQVVLQVKGQKEDVRAHPEQNSDEGWALDCDQEEGTLACTVPVQKIKDKFGVFPEDLKIWLDEPPYFGRPGLWADSDVSARPMRAGEVGSMNDCVHVAGTGHADVRDAAYPAVPAVGSATTSPGPYWRGQAYAVGDWSEVREVACLECEGQPNHWEATINLKNIELLPAMPTRPGPEHPRSRGKKATVNQDSQLSPYCVQGLEDINGQLAQLADTFKPGSPILKPGSPVLHLQGMKSDKESQRLGLDQYNRAATELQKPSNQQIIATNNHDGSITISVPFLALPAVTQRFRLQHESCQTRAPALDSVLLPELASKLQPGPVAITDLGNGLYRLGGERLRAVSQVRLEGNGQVIISQAYTSLNSVDFAAKSNGKDLPAGKYAILAVIGTMTVPLQTEDADKKLQPATITIVAPPQETKKN